MKFGSDVGQFRVTALAVLCALLAEMPRGITEFENPKKIAGWVVDLRFRVGIMTLAA
jgi:hypothetical protein